MAKCCLQRPSHVHRSVSEVPQDHKYTGQLFTAHDLASGARFAIRAREGKSIQSFRGVFTAGCVKFSKLSLSTPYSPR